MERRTTLTTRLRTATLIRAEISVLPDQILWPWWLTFQCDHALVICASPHPISVAFTAAINALCSCFSVDNIQAACAKLEANQVKFHKKLSGGRMSNIAFVLDPDNYWVELIGQPDSNPEAQTSDLTTYRLNHTMIRVKDPEKSISFYRSIMGMSLLKTIENPNNKFNLYFLGYRHGDETDEDDKLTLREGVCRSTTSWLTFYCANSLPVGGTDVELWVECRKEVAVVIGKTD
jgi:catechol 2,3-dioxygenase-like lactoylglutathione lyase family enzyme